MKKLIFFTMLAMSYGGFLHAMEQFDASPPYVVDPTSTTVLRVTSLYLDWDNSIIDIKLSSGSIKAPFRYSGATAKNMMTILNKANLTSNSLHKRVLNQLISDGFISGTVSGNPD